jgi:hypothetical protein
MESVHQNGYQLTNLLQETGIQQMEQLAEPTK